jgi:hypothetical protein
MRAKHMIDHFEEFFQGFKIVEAPSKNPTKRPIICFASMQKITSQTFRISGAIGNFMSLCMRSNYDEYTSVGRIIIIVTKHRWFKNPF